MSLERSLVDGGYDWSPLFHPVDLSLVRINLPASLLSIAAQEVMKNDAILEDAAPNLSTNKEILHCFVKGLADKDIREEVLGMIEEIDLETTVKYVEAKGSVKKADLFLDRGAVPVEDVTEYKKNQGEQTIVSGTKSDGSSGEELKCRFCNKRGHGLRPFFKKKKAHCPAFDKTCKVCGVVGHFARTKACAKKDVKVKKLLLMEHEITVKEKRCGRGSEVDNAALVEQIDSLCDDAGHVIKLFSNKAVPHMVEVRGKWNVQMPKDHPMLRVELEVDVESYSQFGLELKLSKKCMTKEGRVLQVPKVSLLCDTGSEVDCVSRSQMQGLGLVEGQLLQPAFTVGCVNGTTAHVVGIFFGKATVMDCADKVYARVMFYVVKSGGNILSRATCETLGIIDRDFHRIRGVCGTCVQSGTSQPVGTPVIPPSVSYPFQMIVADYCYFNGKHFLLLGCRYSGWLSSYVVGGNKFDTDKLLEMMRNYFMLYGVAEEVASDMGLQFKSAKFEQFLKRYGVHHRQSIAYYGQSNCRGEFAVKTGKQMLRDNLGVNGESTDGLARSLLQYRNSPLPDSRMSPAEIVFGRNMKDLLPVLNYKYEPRQEWGLVRELREKLMAKRLDRDGVTLEGYTKAHKDIPVGSSVVVQNKAGKFPRKWVKTGIVVENMDYDKVLVKLDGSGRLTSRNIKNVKKIISPPDEPMEVVPVVEKSTDNRDTSRENILYDEEAVGQVVSDI